MKLPHAVKERALCRDPRLKVIAGVFELDGLQKESTDRRRPSNHDETLFR
jgi:hypothetical protein